MEHHALRGADAQLGGDASQAEGRPLIVVDASVVLDAVLSPDGLEPLAYLGLVAPPLLWSEATSSLREATWRGLVNPETAREGMRRLMSGPMKRRSPRALHTEAWQIAEQLGWAKTYDAEYVALSRLLDCPLLTRDARLKRGAGGLIQVVGPTEI